MLNVCKKKMQFSMQVDLDSVRFFCFQDVSFRECERRFLSSASEAKKRIIEMGAQKKARGKRRRKK